MNKLVPLTGDAEARGTGLMTVTQLVDEEKITTGWSDAEIDLFLKDTSFTDGNSLAILLRFKHVESITARPGS